MKFNPECVRDVLLYLEDNLKIINNNEFSIITLNQLQDALSDKFTEDEITYAVYNLRQVHFIEGGMKDIGNKKLYFCDIENITWNGHQFLNTVRPETIWKATLNKAKQMGGMSLTSLSIISTSIMQGLASNSDFIQTIVDKLN